MGSVRGLSPYLLWFMFFSSLFYLYGYVERRTLMAENACKMTFSTRDFSLVNSSQHVSKYKLWKVTGAGKKRLMEQPVLFIPGHMGRYWFFTQIVIS